MPNVEDKIDEDEGDEDEHEIEEAHDSQYVVGESIHAIYQDRSGVLWFGTDAGLNTYDGQTFTLYSYNPEDPDSLEHNPVALMYEDRLGNLWFIELSAGAIII